MLHGGVEVCDDWLCFEFWFVVGRKREVRRVSRGLFYAFLNCNIDQTDSSTSLQCLFFFLLFSIVSSLVQTQIVVLWYDCNIYTSLDYPNATARGKPRCIWHKLSSITAKNITAGLCYSMSNFISSSTRSTVAN